MIRFFLRHPRLMDTPAGRRALWVALAHVSDRLRTLQAVRALYPEPAWWLEQAACIRSHEGAWTSNTGNGFYGAYQFMLGTWHNAGGEGYPHEASEAEQTYRAWVVWKADGGSWREWPNTSRMCGLR